MTVLTLDDVEKINEIVRLHDEAFQHYRATGGDGWKSSEGYVEIRTGTVFDREAGDRRVGVGVYSYVLGPSRMHDFASPDEALAAVREWHAQALSERGDGEPLW